MCEAGDSAATERLDVDVVRREEADWSHAEPVETLIAAAIGAIASEAALAGRWPARASLLLSSDADVARLNGRYRGRAQPTNVLSFPAAAGALQEPGAPSFLGDVVLAAETVAAEAAELAIPAAHHIQHLVVHGLLHLMGYDHEEEADAERMEALETRILARIGVPDPYAERQAEPAA